MDIYQEYDEAGNAFYTACDGLVATTPDAIKAVKFYKAFYNKLEYENKLNDKIEAGFNRTIEKYSCWKNKKIQKLIEAHDKGEYCGDPFKGVDFSKNAIVVGHINYCDYSNDEQYIEYFGKYMKSRK